LWFIGQHRVKALAVLTVGSALGNMLGSVLGGMSLSLNGVLGLTGWQWIFVITGMPALLLVPVVLSFLPSAPREAKFLSQEEAVRLSESVKGSLPSGAPQHGSILSALWDARVLLFAIAYTFLLTAYYGVIYWLPTVVKQFGVSNAQNGLLNMIPWALAAVMLVWIPRYFRINGILTILAVISAIGLLCFFGSVSLGSAVERFSFLSVGTVSVSLLLPCFWYFASRFFTDERAVVSIAAICSYANLGGFFAQNMMPRIAQALGSPVAAMLVPASCLAILGLAAFAIRWYPYVTGRLAGEVAPTVVAKSA
jgi:MFS family permease